MRFNAKTDAEVLKRVLAKCQVMPSGCWEWQGFRHAVPRHYGGTAHRGKSWRAHRLVFSLAKGPIPEGMIVMHSCDNPPCCNPDHLNLGTHLQNMTECRAKDRYYYANLTHCKHGHEFNEENTYYIPTPGEAQGLRKCRACARARNRIKAGWPADLAYSMAPTPKGLTRLIDATTPK